MSNGMYNVLAHVTVGLYEGIAIRGDVHPGSTLSDHALVALQQHTTCINCRLGGLVVVKLVQ